MIVRPLTQEDGPRLTAFEARWLPQGRTSRSGEAALRFFARSGHSFVAEAEEVQGFVLAQALWQGDRATVIVSRLLANGPEAYEALLRALEKSAYDAGAYEVALFADEESPLAEAAKKAAFVPGPRLFVRVLGSRKETRGVLE